MKQPSRSIINGRIVCAIHNPRPDQRAHRRDERPRREFDRPDMVSHAVGVAPGPIGAVAPEQRVPAAVVDEPRAAAPGPLEQAGEGTGAPAAASPAPAIVATAEAIESATTPPAEPPAAAVALPSDVPAAQGPAVTPEEVPAPGEQDTVPSVAADPALQEMAAEPTADGAATNEEATEDQPPARRARRSAAETESEATT